MICFNFIASNNFDLRSLESVEKFVDSYPDFQTVPLNNEDELKLLFELMGINEFIEHKLDNSNFCKYWDLSFFKLPEFDTDQLDEFYRVWIQKSKRENTMNEYGSLLFLQGLTSKWNTLNYRLVVKER